MIINFGQGNCSYRPCTIYIKVLANLKDYKAFPYGFDLQKALTKIMKVFFFFVCMFVMLGIFTDNYFL